MDQDMSFAEDEGSWTTINGSAVHLDKDGNIDKGPKDLMGKKGGHLVGDNPKDGKGGEKTKKDAIAKSKGEPKVRGNDAEKLKSMNAFDIERWQKANTDASPELKALAQEQLQQRIDRIAQSATDSQVQGATTHEAPKSYIRQAGGVKQLQDVELQGLLKNPNLEENSRKSIQKEMDNRGIKELSHPDQGKLLNATADKIAAKNAPTSDEEQAKPTTNREASMQETSGVSPSYGDENTGEPTYEDENYDPSRDSDPGATIENLPDDVQVDQETLQAWKDNPNLKDKTWVDEELSLWKEGRGAPFAGESGTDDWEGVNIEDAGERQADALQTARDRDPADFSTPALIDLYEAISDSKYQITAASLYQDIMRRVDDGDDVANEYLSENGDDVEMSFAQSITAAPAMALSYFSDDELVKELKEWKGHVDVERLITEALNERASHK